MIILIWNYSKNLYSNFEYIFITYSILKEDIMKIAVASASYEINSLISNIFGSSSSFIVSYTEKGTN